MHKYSQFIHDYVYLNVKFVTINMLKQTISNLGPSLSRSRYEFIIL